MPDLTSHPYHEVNRGFNGVGALTSVESTAESLYRGYTVGIEKRGGKVQFQAYYTYSKDKSDDDNERDPFSFRYARITDLDAEWGFSDRDQRDRNNPRSADGLCGLTKEPQESRRRCITVLT